MTTPKREGVYLPPILARQGVQFIGMEDNGSCTSIVFSTPDDGAVTLVKVRVTAKSITYSYAIHHPETGTMTYYQGPFGDPEKDEVDSIDTHDS